MMSFEDATWLTEATDRLLASDAQTDGRPSFDPSERPRLERAVERVVADIAAVRRHALLLMSRTKNLRHNQLFDSRQCESVMERRLAALTDEELARVVLNPIALGQLHHQVFFQRPDAWRKLLIDAPDVVIEPDTGSSHLLDDAGRDEAPQATEELEELVAALQGRDDDTPRWAFEAPAGLVKVLHGQAPAEGEVNVWTAWLDNRQYLVVQVAGLFRARQHVTLTTRLLDGELGGLRVETQMANFDAPFLMVPSDRLPPRPGDRLEIHYRKSLPKSPDVTEWVIEFTFGEPNQPAP